MPAIKQRRKASTRPKTTPTQQPAEASIASFARISKTISHPEAKKEQASTPKKAVKVEAITPASRKRKAVATVDNDSSADERPTKLVLPPSTPSKTPKPAVKSAKPNRGSPLKQARPTPTPRKRARSPSVSDSDDVNTGALLKKLRLESSPSRSSSPLTANTSIADSDVSDSEPAKSHQLPEEVLSLISLHSALLKTLTIHYAHNGTNVPVDLRVLCPNVARAWGKKKVTAAEIRICIGVLNSNATASQSGSNLFSLLNYGRGKVCIEIDTAHGSRPLNEKKLNDQFSDNMRSLWAQHLAAHGDAGDDVVSTFTSTLPKAPIPLCASVVKAAPVLARGQRRLEEFKSGLAAKKQEKESSSASPSSSASAKPNSDPASQGAAGGADSPKMSLLDRIRMKSLQKATALPTAGLSPEQLARRAALQRVEEVSSLVGMLSRATDGGDSGRVAFPMPTLLEKLKDSFRMGISREEGAACVRLLAAEVAPEWVRVVVIGTRENVVVEADAQVGRAEVARRVRALMERV
ncbi:hypothetical protein F5X96DRAFT_361137 [Biscogniauxia mediterranea]|nr:hypothetical protein F5X96DRAFT_361137 [Biscogniauxia mediterranea]